MQIQILLTAWEEGIVKLTSHIWIELTGYHREISIEVNNIDWTGVAENHQAGSRISERG